MEKQRAKKTKQKEKLKNQSTCANKLGFISKTYLETKGAEEIDVSNIVYYELFENKELFYFFEKKHVLENENPTLLYSECNLTETDRIGFRKLISLQKDFKYIYTKPGLYLFLNKEFKLQFSSNSEMDLFLIIEKTKFQIKPRNFNHFGWIVEDYRRYYGDDFFENFINYGPTPIL